MNTLNFPGLARILVVDDEEGTRESLRLLLANEGAVVETAPDIDQAQQRLAGRAFDIVFLAAGPSWGDSLSTLPALRTGAAPAEVVILTGCGASGSTVEAMRKGAADVIEKPVTRDSVLAVVRRCLELRQLRHELTWLQERVHELSATELVGLSPAIRGVITRIDQVAYAPDAALLITGESGTGKELVARGVHERSARRHGPFASVNCAAFSENQLEAELFGYEAGAFAGGTREAKDGLLAAAAGGTLFLDGIGEMQRSLQAKLLRVLQERVFRKVGGIADVHADVRVIASTTRDLRRDVAAGTFRDDLFYRLNALAIAVPPLRERAEDIPLLSHFFLDRFGRQMGKALGGFTAEAMETLGEYAWPGNVRELRNAIEYAAIVCTGGMIDEDHLPRFTGGRLDGKDAVPRNVFSLDVADRSLRGVEGVLVARVLDETNWNISRAATLLGINRTTLYNKIKLHNLGRRPDQRSGVGAR